MGTPITWQNVNAPDNRLAAQLFESSQNSINSGLDRFTKIITDREKGDQVMADRARMATEQEYLNMVQGYKTPEELQAARMSGVLDQRLAALDPRNQAAVRGAVDARVTGLQGQVTANDKFGLEQIAARGAVANAEAIAGRVPTQIALDDAALANKVALQPGADRIALVEQLNKERTTNFNTQRAPGLEALTLQEDKVKGSTLTVQAKQNQDAIEDQNVTTATAKVATAYQAAQLQDRSKLGALATQLGLPVDAAGAPDKSRISQGDLLKLNHEAVLRGMRTTTDLDQGDTKETNKFAQSLVGQGFSAEAVSRNKAKIDVAFNTIANGAAVGNDAYNNALKQAKIDTAQETSDANNWYAPNSPNALRNNEELQVPVAAMFPPTSNMAEDLAPIAKLLHKIGTVGVEVKKGVFLTPSKQDILNAIRGRMGDNNLRDAERAEDIEDDLKANLSTSRVTDLIKQSEASKAVNEQRSIREKVRDALYGAPAKK